MDNTAEPKDLERSEVRISAPDGPGIFERSEKIRKGGKDDRVWGGIALIDKEGKREVCEKQPQAAGVLRFSSGERKQKTLASILVRVSKNGSCLLSHLVGQYHRRWRA